MNRIVISLLLFCNIALAQADYATINIYRPKKMQGSAGKFHILINNIEIGVLKNGGHIEYKVFTENTFNISAYAVNFGIREKATNMGSVRVKGNNVYHFEMNAKFGFVEFKQVNGSPPVKKLKSKNFISKSDIGYISNSIVYNHPSTEWTRDKLIQHWRLNGYDRIEGIYEKTSKLLKYELALVKENNDYKLVYLSGANGTSWKEGDLKSILQKTANSRIFKSEWFMLDKTSNSNIVITFEGTSMRAIDGNINDLYLKIFPTYDEEESSKESSNWKSSGSGFFIDKEGFLVTNYHVVKDGSEFEVGVTKDGETTFYQAEIITMDKSNDLAILRLKSGFKPLKNLSYNFETKTQDVGTSVFALGYPLTELMGDEIKFTDGKISSKSGFQGDITTYQISVPIQNGNSGGPLFDENLNLIGITSSGINRKLDLTENVNYAIKTSYLNLLIEASNESINLPISQTYKNIPVTEQIKILSEYVVFIKVR